MAGRENKFKNRYNSRNKTATDDFVDQLYENEKPAEESAVEPVIQSSNEIIESIPAPTVPTTLIPSPVVEEVAPPVVKEKRKVGRPRKTNEERNIFNIKLSVSEKEMLDVASSASGKNRVDYIVGLIKKDYEANRDYYDSVKARIMENR